MKEVPNKTVDKGKEKEESKKEEKNLEPPALVKKENVGLDAFSSPPSKKEVEKKTESTKNLFAASDNA